MRDFSINSRYEKQSGINSLDVKLLEFFNILMLCRGSRIEHFVVQSVVENQVQKVYHILLQCSVRLHVVAINGKGIL